MRQIKIDKTNIKTEGGETIFCPVQSHPKSDGLCQTDCAWFRITCKEIDKESEREEGESNDKYVYCGNKLIGKIKE